MSGREFFGGLLFAVGALIASLCGLCSVAVVAMGLPSMLRGPSVLSNLVMGAFMVGMFGGLPFAIGVALMVAGRAASRPDRPRKPDPGSAARP